MTNKRNLLLSLALTPSFLLAGGLSGPVSFPSAKVLPKNIRNFTYKGIYTQGNKRYNGNGNTESIGAAFDRTITYQDLVNSEETLQDQLFAEAKINNAPGISLNDKMGSTNGAINLAVNVHASVFAYGLSDKLTIAAVVPVVQSSLNADVGSVADESLQVIADYFAQPGQSMKSKLETVRAKFENAVQDTLRKDGYDELKDDEKTELGDIQIHGKYKLAERDKARFALLTSVTLPTGTKSDADKLVDVGSGDEQWDLGIGVAADYDLNKKLSISASANYIAQLAHETKSRIYEKEGDRITSQVDNNTTRDLGDIYQVALATKYSIQDNLKLSGAYSYQYKEEDIYSGSKFDKSNYEYTSFETEQEMQALQIGLSFDTITMYRKKQFMAPMEMAINWTKPIAGQNVLTDDLLSATMSLYF